MLAEFNFDKASTLGITVAAAAVAPFVRTAYNILAENATAVVAVGSWASSGSVAQSLDVRGSLLRATSALISKAVGGALGCGPSPAQDNFLLNFTSAFVSASGASAAYAFSCDSGAISTTIAPVSAASDNSSASFSVSSVGIALASIAGTLFVICCISSIIARRINAARAAKKREIAQRVSMRVAALEDPAQFVATRAPPPPPSRRDSTTTTNPIFHSRTRQRSYSVDSVSSTEVEPVAPRHVVKK